MEAWGEPTFRVRNRLFAMFASAGTHHGGGRHSVWVKATRENQEWMVRGAPDRYFVPPYVGVSGWVGVYLDGATDWTLLASIVADAYRSIAPKRLLVAQRESVTPAVPQRKGAAPKTVRSKRRAPLSGGSPAKDAQKLQPRNVRAKRIVKG